MPDAQGAAAAVQRTGGPGAIWIHASTVDITGTITRGSLTGYSDMRIDAWSYSVPYADYEYCPPIDMPVP